MDDDIQRVFAKVDSDRQIFRTALSRLDFISALTKPDVMCRVVDARRIAEDTFAKFLPNQKERHAILNQVDPLGKFFGHESMSMFSTVTQTINNTIAEQENQFRVPSQIELQNLVERYQKKFFEPVSRTHQHEFDFVGKFRGLRQPWLKYENEFQSIQGLTKLHYLGRVLEVLPPFGEELTKQFRIGLGDWRERIDWNEAKFTDLSERLNFYVEQGLDPTLTDFPVGAFEENVIIAGIKIISPPIAKEYAFIPNSENWEDGSNFMGMKTAYDLLGYLEICIRNFIDKQMQVKFGPDWYKGQVPSDMHTQWRDKEENAKLVGASVKPLIFYADFTDYQKIIIQKHNWNNVFKVIFKRKESVIESFQRIYPIRNSVMHFRPIATEDLLYLYSECHRLLKAVGSKPV